MIEKKAVKKRAPRKITKPVLEEVPQVVVAEEVREIIEVNHKPIHEFSYVQNLNHNFKLTLLNKENQIVFNPVQCKEYFQDIFYSEYTGNPAGIYGLSWRQGMFDISGDYFKLLLIGGGVKLNKHAHALETFMNFFDKAQGFNPTKVLQTTVDEEIVVVFSKEWTQNGPLLSAYLNLVRIAGNYEEKWSAKEYLALVKPGVGDKIPLIPYTCKDITNMSTTYGRILALLEGKKPTHSWGEFSGISAVHTTGLATFSRFPTMKEA